MTDGEQDARLRNALPPDVSVPPKVSERMLAAIHAEPGNQIAQGDELATRRRPSSTRKWVIGAAAAAVLLLAVGVRVSGPQVEPSGQHLSRPIAQVNPESTARADVAGDTAADTSVAGGASILGGSAIPERPQAKAQMPQSPSTLTAETIADHVQRLLGEVKTQQSLSAQCAALVGRFDAPAIAHPIDFEGSSGLLVVWSQPDSYAVWVLADECADANSILYHSMLSAPSAE